MANKEHIKRLKRTVDGLNDFKGWNKWRAKNRKIVPDLSAADLDEVDLIGDTNLNGADLGGTSLWEASLEEIRLRRANLEGADLRYSHLEQSDLRGADLSHTDLTGAHLQGADMRGVSLRFARVEGAHLAGANLSEAVVGYTTFANCDLRGAKGLETIRHEGPSTIGIDTIFRSEGRIQPTFLRRAGVPDIFLEYLSPLTAPGAIQFYSCFISYSTRDEEFADRLYADLQNKSVRCWFAPHDVQGGKKLHEQIDEAIRRYERLLLILSPNSMSSKWVKTEIRNARKREMAEKRRVLFPVRLASYEVLRDWKLFDADEGEDLATEVREYYIPDFSEWKNHDSYAREFEKLLRDLRTDEYKSV
jgi:uncharacterized protein YjbI with pentapeptide repeats